MGAEQEKDKTIQAEFFNGERLFGSKMIDKITEFLNDSTEAKNKFAVNRILIMDGGGNAVKILREIIDY